MSELNLDELWTLLKRFRERYNNLPVALKMSRETMIRASATFDIQIGEVTTVFEMPIYYDESIPFGKFEEVFDETSFPDQV